MRIFSSMVVGGVIALGVPAAFASTTAFEDNKLNFRSCDGAAVTARWRGTSFSLAEPGKSLGDAHASFKFVAWDGSCQTARWDGDRAMFVIDGASSAKPSTVVRYVAPDGSKWAGIRAGDGFFVTRIAAQDEQVSVARMQEIAAWLARTSKEFTFGAELAKRLNVLAVD